MRSLARRSPGMALLTLVMGLLSLLGTVTWIAPAYAAAQVSQFGPAATGEDWSMYLHDVAHTSTSGESILSPTNAGQLAKLWAYKTGGLIATSAAIVNGTVYVGSWDGYEYALDAATGALKWKTSLGTTSAPQCQDQPATLGITSGAAVVNGVVYVGGGDNNWYALDAATGAIQWKINTGDNSQTGGHYNWSSPLVYNNFAYVGIASNCDNPLVQGQVLKVDLTAHQVVNTFNLVPNGQVGGGIWTTPALDTQTNMLLLTTGTKPLATQTMAQAMVAIDATTFAFKGSWTIPQNDTVDDSDWGNSPVVYTDGNGRRIVAGVNKNGYLYAFDESNIGAGPVWRDQVAFGGDCPQCGGGSISSAVYMNGVLYVAGGATAINGTGYRGSVRAINPTTGAYIWEHGTPGAVLGALAGTNGLIIDNAGSYMEVLNAATGDRLYNYKTGGFYGSPSISHGVIYDGSLDMTMYAFALNPKTTPPDANCPAGWICQDIGAPTPAGSETGDTGSLTINAGGDGLYKATDQFRMVAQNLAGNMQVAARVTAIQAVNASAVAGVMVRQNTDTGSPYYSVYVTPDKRLIVAYRGAFGIESSIATEQYNVSQPLYLMIQRSGEYFQAALSTDGVTYTLMPGSTVAVIMPTTLLTGAVASSSVQGTLGSATFTNLSAGPVTTTVQTPPSPTPCPATWNCADIGNPAIIGSQTLNNGVLAVTAGGTDIGFGVSDQFHYVWQSLAGDGTVSARVATQQNTSQYAKAGVMLRQSTDATSAFYAALVTPGGGVEIEYRTVTGLNATLATSVAGVAPDYVRVARAGNTFKAFTSPDGVTWTIVPNSTFTFALPTALLAGVAVTSHSATSGKTTIDAIAINAGTVVPPTTCPTGWNCGEVGAPLVAGTQSLANGTWTIQGSGGDIFTTADDFHMVWQTLTGDATVAARVVSQTNTNPSAKAGVMIRQSTDTASPYYAALVTPSNGVVVQYRTDQGATTTQIQIATSAAPVYLMIARSISTFTTYTSTDGKTWAPVVGTAATITLTDPVMAGLVVNAHNPGVLGTAVFDTVSIVNSSPLPPAVCPLNWNCADIGNPLIAGSQTVNNNTWTIQGSGGDMWGAVDQFHYAWQTVAGDATLAAQVVSQTNTNPSAKAGVMFRQSTDTASPYYAALVTPSNGVIIQYRMTQGAGTMQMQIAPTAAPVYLEIVRSGNTFATFSSADGITWSPVLGSNVTLGMSGTLLAGLAVTAHNPGALSTVTFAAISLTNSAPLPPGACPTNWTCADVGNPLIAGTQAQTSTGWVLQGSGGDIWGTIDQFHFLAQNLAGDGSLAARVVSQTNTDPSAKAGVMIRQSTDTASPYYAALVTPSNGVIIQYRVSQGAGTMQMQIAPTAAPVYLMVGRVGNSFTAYTSADGVTWSPMPGTTVTLSTSGTLLAGLAVTAHNPGALSTVTFDNLTLTAPTQSGACPTGWTCQDVGNPQKAGSQTLTGTTWAIQGNGSDIFGTTDRFHYVTQNLPANGTLTARVVSQTNTNAAAKAGVMFRQSTDAGAAYYAIFATPGKGIIVQYRMAQGATTKQIKIVGTTPTFLRITRVGNTFTAYTSADGVTWTAVNNATVTLSTSGTLLAGLAVTSHNISALSTATFDAVNLVQN